MQLRLKQHKQDYNANKEDFYWTHALVFTGRDLNKAKIRFLENELIKDAIDAKRYNVLTKSSYGKTILKESEIAEMQEFISNIKILVSTLGYNVFKKNALTNEEKKNIDNLYFIKTSKADATMSLSPEGFILLAGSKIREDCVPSFKKSSKGASKLRVELIENKTLNDKYVLEKDIIFSSPSAASDFVLGRSSNEKSNGKIKMV